MSPWRARVGIAVAILLPACGRLGYDAHGDGGADAAVRDGGDAGPPPADDYFLYVAAGLEIHVFAPTGPDRTPVASAPPTAGATIPRAFAPHPSGRFLYVMDEGPKCHDLYGFEVDAADGSLRSLGPPTLVSIFQAESRVLCAVSGDAVYVTGDGDETVNLFQYSVDPASGRVTAFDTPAVVSGSTPGQLVMTPDRRFVYVANTASNDVSYYTVEDNGALTWIDDVGTCEGTRGVAVHPTANILYVACAGAPGLGTFVLDAASGAVGAPLVPIRRTGGGARAIALEPGGEFLLLLDDVGRRLLRFPVDPSGEPGASPTVANSGADPVDLALAPDGLTAYVLHAAPSELRTYKLVPSGAIMPLGMPVAAGLNGRAVSVLAL